MGSRCDAAGATPALPGFLQGHWPADPWPGAEALGGFMSARWASRLAVCAYPILQCDQLFADGVRGGVVVDDAGGKAREWKAGGGFIRAIGAGGQINARGGCVEHADKAAIDSASGIHSLWDIHGYLLDDVTTAHFHSADPFDVLSDDAGILPRGGEGCGQVVRSSALLCSNGVRLGKLMV